MFSDDFLAVKIISIDCLDSWRSVRSKIRTQVNQSKYFSLAKNNRETSIKVFSQNSVIVPVRLFNRLEYVVLIHRARTSAHSITNYSSAQYDQKSRWVANIVWREACLSVVSINAQRVFQTRWKNRATPGATAIFGNLEVGALRERSLLHVKTLIKPPKHTHESYIYGPKFLTSSIHWNSLHVTIAEHLNDVMEDVICKVKSWVQVVLVQL